LFEPSLVLSGVFEVFGKVFFITVGFLFWFLIVFYQLVGIISYDFSSLLANGANFLHLIQVDCSVHYVGRGETFLDRGVRLLMIKSDGSVSLHQDKNMQPLNYMAKTTDISEFVDDDGFRHMLFSSKREHVDVTVYKVLFEQHLDGFVESDLERHGTEGQLQKWLSLDGNLAAVMGDGTKFVCREYETGKGPVDLLGVRDGHLVLIEVKRFARRSDTFQLVRYHEALRERCADARCLGKDTLASLVPRSDLAVSVDEASDPVLVLVAERFGGRTKEECERLGIEWRQVRHADWCES
jgi:RecB family endonuclease NucS